MKKANGRISGREKVQGSFTTLAPVEQLRLSSSSPTDLYHQPKSKIIPLRTVYNGHVLERQYTLYAGMAQVKSHVIHV